MELTISILALLGSSLAALYARWASSEAKKANQLSRLNSLLAFRNHYLELMAHQEKLGKLFKGLEGGTQRVHETYADLDLKLREVSSEIEKYHEGVVKNDI